MNMKKYIKSLLMLVLAAMALTGCREEVGTDPGNDGYSYSYSVSIYCRCRIQL